VTDRILERADWHWAYDVASASGRPAEWWARAVFEDGPRALRWFVLFGWVVVLRLRLGPRNGDGYILGWRIESNEAGRTVLGTEAAVLAARLVITTGAERVTHATFLRYDRRRARVVWPLIAWLHKLIIGFLMRRAAKS